MAALVLGSSLQAGASPAPGSGSNGHRRMVRPSPAAIARLDRRALDRRLRGLQRARLPLHRRIAYWSVRFLGTPYWVPPAGHQAPRGLDLRKVDCETFVEQVMALSLSPDIARVSPTLRAIRFTRGRHGAPHRHFTVARGWLAHNERAGLLRDITREVGGAATRVERRDLTPGAAWRPYYLRRFMALGVDAPTGVAEITYIPMNEARGIARRIPSGTVLHVVSPPHPRSPYLVTHVGFVLQTGRGPILRHASESPGRRRVEDRPLRSYLRYIATTPAGPEMRTGTGIHLSEVRAPGEPSGGTLRRSPPGERSGEALRGNAPGEPTLPLGSEAGKEPARGQPSTTR